MYQTIQWTRTAWDEVTADPIKNCWNTVKMLSIPAIVVGGGERNNVMDELRALLFQWATNATL